MGARTSSEMLQAIELIKCGETAAKAARMTGISYHAIIVSKLYKDLRRPKIEWSNEENEILLNNYKKHGLKFTMSLLPGRTINSVRKQISRLKANKII